jgi:Leucine-rich repeat (LRR) protein
VRGSSSLALARFRAGFVWPYAGAALRRYCNRIPKIEGLDSLVNLETLWLNDNLITELAGLTALVNLRCCFLASNKIDRVGNGFDSCTQLEDVNLSNNLIGCFREIPNLGRLPNLQSLYLNDNLFGENPVVSLCNYQTYALFHLQNLANLDGCPLSDDAKNMAEATYMKKKMYYNMRIKTMKRNCTNVLKKAQEAKQAAISQNNLSLNVLVRARKDVEREVDERQFLPPHEDQSQDASAEKMFLAKLQLKLQALEQAISGGNTEIGRVDETYAAFKTKCYGLVQQSIANLILELETGGNIRLEDGKPSDVWHSSCVDLVQSRFFPQDYTAFNIAGVKVTRVHRVHNRFLRNRFDARLESLVDIADSSYKKSLEYLFYGEIPGTPDLQSIMEEGFPSAEAYQQLGMDGAVPLSNSVSTSDLPRVNHTIEVAGEDPSVLRTDSNMQLLSDVRTGRLLIAKVYLGKYVQEQARREEDEEVASPAPITADEYDSANSVFRVKPGDSKQRQWFIFDHALALPEYVIEFEYQLQKPVHVPSEAANSKLLAEIGLEEISGAVRDRNGADYGYLGRPLASFCASCAASSNSERGAEESHAAVNMAPDLKTRNKVFLVSEKVVLEACRVPSAANVVYLNLHGNNIRKMDGFAALTAMKTLILSFNEIQKIEGISGLSNLERMDASYNLIKRADGLQDLPALSTLELNNNLLYRLEDVSALKQSVPALTDLNLSHNALCEAKGYRMIVLRRLPNIRMFDRSPVAPDERVAAGEDNTMITDDLLQSKSCTNRRSGWSTAAPAIGDQGVPVPEIVDGWRNMLQELELDHCGIRRLQNLHGLVNLRRASFCDNELTHVEGLEGCTALEELILEENRITQLEGLSTLVYLKRLDVGKNKLTRIEGLDTLTRLTQLSVEDNEISSLAGMSKLSSLMELYIGNNRVDDLKEVHHIKGMSKLIILDLSGNQLCSALDYRHYTIYHVRKLKVLDGAGVEMAEQEAAKDKYDGKLTTEFVVERVGHSFLEHVRELNLAASRVRDVGDVLTEASFPSLKELNLDNNQLVDLSGLLDLPLLTILRLNHNRVEHLGLVADGDHPRPVLPHLEVLQLGYNHINYIPSLRLHCLPELKSLFLQGNDITKIEGLDRCIQLRELILDKNKIKAVSQNSLTSLANLRTLRIECVALHWLL